MCVVGRPEPAAIRAGLTGRPRVNEVLAAPENAEWVQAALPRWIAHPATLHTLVSAPPAISSGEVRLLAEEDRPLLAPLPPELRAFLERELEQSPIAARFVGGRPVSFCYTYPITETLWDLAIDTLEEHRRRGYATECATYLIHHMLERGQQPVWGALDSNVPSLAMAAKLGFRPVDHLVLLGESTSV